MAKAIDSTRESQFCKFLATQRISLTKAFERNDWSKLRGEDERNAEHSIDELLAGELERLDGEADNFFVGEIKSIHPEKLRAIGRAWMESLSPEQRALYL